MQHGRRQHLAQVEAVEPLHHHDADAGLLDEVEDGRQVVVLHQGLNKHYGTRILISESTFQAAGAAIVARPIDYVSVKGKRRPVLIYELLEQKEEAEAESGELAAVQGEALACYRQQDWEEAIRLFEPVLALRPDDPPARRMIARCRAYQANPPGPEWDGVHRPDSK